MNLAPRWFKTLFCISGENGPLLQLRVVTLFGDAKSSTDTVTSRAVETVLFAPFRKLTPMRWFDTDPHSPPPAGFSPLYHIEAENWQFLRLRFVKWVFPLFGNGPEIR